MEVEFGTLHTARWSCNSHFLFTDLNHCEEPTMIAALFFPFDFFFFNSRLLFELVWPADRIMVLVTLLPLLHFACKAPS